MSEHIGGESGDLSENNEFDLDIEWAALDEALQMSSEEQLAAMERQAEYDAEKVFVMQSLYDAQIPHVVDIDPDREVDLLREYMMAYYGQKRDEQELAGLEVDDDFERATFLRSVYEYFDEREFEATVINSATLYRYMLHSKERSETIGLYVVLLKKQLQAELMVQYRRPFDDSWQRFFDEMVPGEGLDFESDGDMYYVEMAQEGLLEFHKTRLERRQIVGEVKAMLGINDETHEIRELVQITADFINMQVIAAEPIRTEQERANRNAQLWDIGRSLSFSEAQVRQVVDLLDSMYPITDS